MDGQYSLGRFARLEPNVNRGILFTKDLFDMNRGIIRRPLHRGIPALRDMQNLLLLTDIFDFRAYVEILRIRNDCLRRFDRDL